MAHDKILNPLEVFEELIKIRALLDEDLPKGKQRLTNYINDIKMGCLE